jgi:hypothetical protein
MTTTTDNELITEATLSLAEAKQLSWQVLNLQIEAARKLLPPLRQEARADAKNAPAVVAANDRVAEWTKILFDLVTARNERDYQSGPAQCMDRLRGVDGVRRTWQRMLEPGAAGSGVIPWVSDLAYWDQVYTTSHVTYGTPVLTPAFVEWRSPTPDDIEHRKLPYPFVIVHQADFVGSNNWSWPSAMMNGTICDDDDCAERMDAYYADPDMLSAHGFAVPLWSVNPIESRLADDWRDVAVKHWDAHHEIRQLGELSSESESHNTIIDSQGRTSECPSSPYGESPDDYWMRECVCGVQQEQELLDANMHAGVYFPPLGAGFQPTWERTVGRWTIGWNEISQIGGNECLSSSVQQLSPFYRR